MADFILLFGISFLLLTVVLTQVVSNLPELDINGSRTTEDYSSSDACAEVRQVFVMKQIGLPQMVPEGKIKGDDLEFCSASTTCCTKHMEESYAGTVKKDFSNMLQASSSYLKTLMATSVTKLRANFLDMIHVSENNTNVLFSEVYKKMDTVAKVPVGQLYSDLAAYIKGQDITLEVQVAAFFDSLFPLVYHHSINPKLKDFSKDYKECLQATQVEIRPFGDIPNKIILNLKQSFQAARTLLQALNLGVEVINTTNHMDFGSECTKALLKLTYCAHCQAMVAVKPCNNYCLNVARGCLANIAELDQPWSEFINALGQLTSGMVNSHNIEEVLSMLDTKISEAIMYAMENGPELSKRVKHACGHPKRASRDISESPVSELPGKIMPVRSPESSLYLRLQHLINKLRESQSFFGNLADNMCNDDKWAIKEESSCWNGVGLGEYSKTIAGTGISGQRYNPEMKFYLTKDLTVATLIDKLQHVKQILSSRNTAVPQSDSYVMEGSGSGGFWHNRVGDDEDYGGGSGSGDWDGGTRIKVSESDFNFDSGDSRNRNQDTNVNGNNNAITLLSNTYLILVVHLGLFLIKYFMSQ